MKKPLLLSLLFIGSAAATHAQESRIGIKAGGTLSSYVGNDVTTSSSNKLGIHGGIIVDLDLNDRLSIQPELLYSMKGIEDKIAAGNAITATGYQTLHYLDVPVLLKAKFEPLFLEAGLQAGVLIDAQQTIEGGPNSGSKGNKDAFKDVDLGYALGFGLQAESGLMIGLRYNGGFTNVPKPNVSSRQTTQADARNSAFQLYVGYLFGGN